MRNRDRAANDLVSYNSGHHVIEQHSCKIDEMRGWRWCLYVNRLSAPQRLNTAADSSGATTESSYAQEAVLVLLSANKKLHVETSSSIHYHLVPKPEQQTSTFCHILASISHKAKHVSGSTSRAGTLAGVLGKELTQLVAMR